ncbi:MAG TPA: hypothetical protein VF463_00440 [Sphingobium sp.]
MGLLWNCEHLERRIDRHYLLAAASKIPGIRQLHLVRARHYRQLLAKVRALTTTRPNPGSQLVEG